MFSKLNTYLDKNLNVGREADNYIVIYNTVI